MRLGLGLGLAMRRGGWRFDPAALAGATPTLWLDPALPANVLADGASVDGTITNSGSVGGTFAQGTAAKRPLYRTNAGNGFPGWDHDGADDELDSSATAASFGLNGAWTQVAVVNLDGLAAAAGSPWLDAAAGIIDANGNVGMTVRDNAGTPQVGCYRFGGAQAYATMQGTGTVQIVSAGYNGSSESFAKHNVNAAVTAAASGTSCSGVARTGAYTAGANHLNGKVLCLLAFNSYLGAAARESVIRGLARKYGVAL